MAARDRNPTSSTSVLLRLLSFSPSLLLSFTETSISQMQEPPTKHCTPLLLYTLLITIYNVQYRVVFFLRSLIGHFSHHTQFVVRACRAILSCSVCPKSASSRAQCLFFLAFFFENRRPHAGPRVSEKQKKVCPKPAKLLV